MATYATPADFIGEFNIPDKATIAENLQWFINKYEPQLPTEVGLYPTGFVYELMGKDLYTAYVADPTEERFTILVEPFLKAGSIRYVYWFYLKDQSIQNLSTGAAQSKKTNARTVSPYPKMVNAWNELVPLCRKFHKYMVDNKDIYPEYKVSFPEWFWGWGFWDGIWTTWFFDYSNWAWRDCHDIPEIYRFKNSLGI